MAYDPAAAVRAAQAPLGRYKDGECWTHVQDSVVGAGGKSSKDLTPSFASNASFVWGTPIQIKDLRSGDVLQFSGYKWHQKVTVSTTHIPMNADNPDSVDQVPEQPETRGEPQHSAIVVRVVSPGLVEVVEQNIPQGSGPVQTVQLALIAGPPVIKIEVLDFDTFVNNKPVKIRRTTKTTTVETIISPPKCYRPIG